MPTGYGDVVEILRDAEAAEEPNPGQAAPLWGPSPSPPSGTASPQSPPSKTPPMKGAGSPPVLSTHTVVFRVPFDPDGRIQKIPATSAAFGYRRPSAVPLLGPSGDVSLLLFPDAGELLVTKNEVINLPAFDPRRYSFGDGSLLTGLQIGRDRALVLGDARRRTSLEEHGLAKGKPPLYIAAERSELRRRALSITRADDGTIGILVLDGPAPETAGVAKLDRASGALSPVVSLAPWSTLMPSSDPRCKADRGAFTALVMVEPRGFFALNSRSLPGVALGTQGIARVRWGRERVCVEAVDMAVNDDRRRADGGTSSLVLQISDKAPRASLLWQGMKQELRCSIAAPASGAR